MELDPILHFAFPILLLLFGFLGIFQADGGRSKTWSWCLFQTGWVAALFLLEPRGGALTLALGSMIAGTSLGTAFLLFAFSRKQDPGSPAIPKPVGRKAAK